MRSLIFGLAALVTGAGSAFSADYAMQKWPDDLAKLPCEAFVRNADGSWTVPGTIILPGNGRLTANTFKGGTEAKIIETHCGPK